MYKKSKYLKNAFNSIKFNVCEVVVFFATAQQEDENFIKKQIDYFSFFISSILDKTIQFGGEND